MEKVIKKKGEKPYVKWKVYNSSFDSWINKEDIIWLSEYFPKLKSFEERVKLELDLSNYGTKADLKKATGADTSKFDKKVDLAKLKR